MNKITDKIEDVQNTPDKRHLDIDKVGIKSIRHPISVKDKTGGDQSTVAMFDMYVHCLITLKARTCLVLLKF
jgi:GTP cyclohydrolase I